VTDETTGRRGGNGGNGEGAGPFGGIPFPQPNWGQTQDCLLCPFGLVSFAVRNTNPEMMEHLMKAGMELMLAFKSLADAAAEKLGNTARADDGLQRIDIS